jgi:hypothetical protein
MELRNIAYRNIVDKFETFKNKGLTVAQAGGALNIAPAKYYYAKSKLKTNDTKTKAKSHRNLKGGGTTTLSTTSDTRPKTDSELKSLMAKANNLASEAKEAVKTDKMDKK